MRPRRSVDVFLHIRGANFWANMPFVGTPIYKTSLRAEFDDNDLCLRAELGADQRRITSVLSAEDMNVVSWRVVGVIVK